MTAYRLAGQLRRRVLLQFHIRLIIARQGADLLLTNNR